MATRLIRDGRTFNGFVQGNPPLYDDFRFVYRLAEMIDRDRYNSGGDVISAEEKRKRNVELLKSKVLSWEGVEDEQGRPIPYSPEVAVSLPPQLLTRVFLIVLGMAVGDVDPQAPATEQEAAKGDKFPSGQ